MLAASAIPISWSSEGVKPPVKKLLFLLMSLPSDIAFKYALGIALSSAPMPIISVS